MEGAAGAKGAGQRWRRGDGVQMWQEAVAGFGGVAEEVWGWRGGTVDHQGWGGPLRRVPLGEAQGWWV